MTIKLSLKKGDLLFNREGTEQGRVCGPGRPCRQIEGCLGWSLPIRWPDGKLTWCCTKAMEADEKGWRLG